MKLAETIKRMVRNSDQLVQLLKETVAGIKNQSRLFNDKHREIVEGLDNQSQLLNAKLQELIEGTVNQSRLLNDKLMAIVHRQDALMELHKLEIAAIRELLSDRGSHGSDLSTIQVPPVPDSPIAPVRPPMEMKRHKTEGVSFDAAVARLPLMLGDKTYNTSHPDYDANLVRNFPGKIFNAEKSCDNIVYANLKKLAKNGTVADAAWRPVLDEALEEAKTVPHADQVFERRAYIENYIKELTEKYGAHYSAGWVNLDDALFLYWLVRKLKPKTIVQTGVCNGLSSAFMMLGLVKNGARELARYRFAAGLQREGSGLDGEREKSTALLSRRANRPAGWSPMPIGIGSRYGTATPRLCCPRWSTRSTPSISFITTPITPITT